MLRRAPCGSSDGHSGAHCGEDISSEGQPEHRRRYPDWSENATLAGQAAAPGAR